LLGSAHLNDTSSAQLELAKLNALHDTLLNQKDFYKAKQVAIQIKSGEAWIAFMKGAKANALNLF